MSHTLELLRQERRARRFFAAYAQSSIGNGARYVALVVVAYDRWRSPWAITLVLMADFVPAMLLGPVFGAAADRWSRRGVAIVSDLMRGAAFVGVALVGGIWATLGFALLAGAGAGMFTPAVLAALPSLVDERRRAAATSLYGGLTDAGRTVGPLLAALALTLTGATEIALANGVTFLVSAAVVATIHFGAAPRDEPGAKRTGLLRQARVGVTAIAELPGITTLVLASSGVILFGAMVNVAELMLARSLGAGGIGFSILVTVFGTGFVAGSLSGARGAETPELKRRYLLGILLIGAGLIVAVVPSFPVVALGLALAGLGNGVTLVSERLICQRVIADRFLGRAFAVFDTAGSWAFAIAFVGAGAVLSTTGVRPVLLVAGVGSVLIWVVAKAALRGLWETEPAPDSDPERSRPLPAPATPAGRTAAEPALAE